MASAARSGAAAAVMAAVAMLSLATAGSAQLQQGFYKGKCNGTDVEAVVRGIVKSWFVRKTPSSAPTLTIRGDVVNAELERRCPGVVSCSDIQILATRDAVALGGGAAYPVRTGRRDRRRSLAYDVRLPAPDYTAAQTTAYYGRLGLSAFDAVLLLGAHTVGATRCSAIKSSRLYAYGGRPGATDPGVDPATASVYKRYVCPNVASSDGNVVFLDDQWSALRVDNHYYRNLQLRRGVLPCDQNLYKDGSTRWIVDLLANDAGLFTSLFPQALVKLSEVNVLTGTQGEIRKVCNRFN
ncbi:hypothetical protein PVAP13_9KG341300 [Panicum virgatum]|uniref:Peroxidase n=1 Tax=Panicum virgatum TaxID=38727 RepID=A0A8T0NQZ8_PANVG|nr:hypothetical protein PVAP13_9KG341300 [Panicum virgatum]